MSEDKEHQIIYTQRVIADRVTQSNESFNESLYEVLPHSFFNHEQAKYLKEPKESLDESSIIFLCDFAKKYSFVV